MEGWLGEKIRGRIRKSESYHGLEEGLERDEHLKEILT